MAQYYSKCYSEVLMHSCVGSGVLTATHCSFKTHCVTGTHKVKSSSQFFLVIHHQGQKALKRPLDSFALVCLVLSVVFAVG